MKIGQKVSKIRRKKIEKHSGKCLTHCIESGFPEQCKHRVPNTRTTAGVHNTNLCYACRHKAHVPCQESPGLSHLVQTFPTDTAWCLWHKPAHKLFLPYSDAIVQKAPRWNLIFRTLHSIFFLLDQIPALWLGTQQKTATVQPRTDTW